ncbi:hypothetical protein L226DRAFT_612278 [Lentinus tigrinus ALCF2SS1-7]|uniref:uncharacterized protein n=1 Tax=Lentinus tigrinus ALCF2SS1-7 TaxID=1328758 RepID=UPI0011660455|nr:hypothetical protein L226DRAFT_612278 [Lentinus tigrinus ALCF2SS1-7]
MLRATMETENANATASTSRTTQAGSTAGKGPELLAYRYNGQTVYVVPAETYERSQQAIDLAQDVFPELVDIARERISICVNGTIGKQAGHIRIAPIAWSVVVLKLSSFEILDVVVQPTAPKGTDNVNQTVDAKASPHYDEPPKYEERKSSSDAEPHQTEGRPGLRSSASTSLISVWAKGIFGKRAA